MPGPLVALAIVGLTLAACSGRDRKKDPPANPPQNGQLISFNPQGQPNDFWANTYHLVVMVHNFREGGHQSARALLSAERAIQIARDFIERRNGLLAMSPFNEPGFQNKIRFWIFVPSPAQALVRSASGLCAGAADPFHAIDDINDAAETSLRLLGMGGKIIFNNYLNTECERNNGSHIEIASFTTENNVNNLLRRIFDVESIVNELIENPELLHDSEEFKDWVVEQLLDRLIHRFSSPRTYVAINEGTVERDLLTDAQTRVHEHEIGHTFRLWDLYFGRDRQGLAGVLQALDQDFDLREFLGLPERIAGLEVPTLTVNLREEMMKSDFATRLLGTPIGFPHCAPDPNTGHAWLRALGVANPEQYFQEAGCLYLSGQDGNGNMHGPYRATNSIMYSPRNHPEFSEPERAWIRWQLTCGLEPNHEICDDLERFDITPNRVWPD